jgi:DMSO/TMAO reductase YedYZ heme-binding membrane subunit
VTSHPWWYVARATGITAWVLLTMTMFGGFGLSNKRARSAVRALALHRFLGGLAVIFVAAHIAALLADRFVDYGVKQVLLPFASVWRPGPVAWGVLAMYLLLVVEVSSLLYRRISLHRWRRLHNLSYPLFMAATIHFLSAGTDVYRWVPDWLTWATGAFAIGASFWAASLAERRLRGPDAPA